MDEKASDHGSQGKKCPKCGYTRQANDSVPEGECPKCGIVYHKFKTEVSSEPRDNLKPQWSQSEEEPRGKSSALGRIIILLLVLGTGFFFYSMFFNDSSLDSKKTIVFSADKCPPCVMAVQYLDEQGVDYIEYNIDELEENYRAFKKAGGKNLPLILIGKERIEGYDESLLAIAVRGLTEEVYEGEAEVVIYVTQKCYWCKKAIKFFEEHGIEYTEYDVGASSEARNRFAELNGRGVPLIFVGENRINGFNEKALRMALEQQGLM